jgi:hypothetical protein
MTTSRNGDDPCSGAEAAPEFAENVLEFPAARLARRWMEVDWAVERLGQEIAAESRIRLPARQSLAVEIAELRSALSPGPDAEVHASIEMVSLVTLFRAVDYRLVKALSPLEGSATPFLRSALRQYVEATQGLVSAYRRGAEHPRSALEWIVREHEAMLERFVTRYGGQLHLGPAEETKDPPFED